MKKNATSSDKYVFISYKSEEKELADRIKSFLEQHGFKWWMAPDSLNQVGTQDYSNDIYRAIRGCSCLIFAVSTSSLSSKWVNREVRYALDKCEKPIIPFVVVPVPERVQEENSLYITMMLEKQILNGDGSWDMEKVLMPYLNRVFGQGGQVDREVEDFDNRADAVSASTSATEVQPNVLAKRLSVEERVKEALGPYWQEFRIIHGVQILDADGQLVPLAGLIVSNRGIFVGVSVESLPSNIRNSLPSENPAWPFAVAVAERCGLPTESPPLFGVLVIPDDYPSPSGGFPFWVIREKDVASKIRSLDLCPDLEKNRQNLIRRLETRLPMSSVGAEANALIHFAAPIPEWEDGAALLPKVERPSARLLAFAQRAAVELERVGNGAATDVFSWLDKFAGTPMPVTVAGVTFNLCWIPSKGTQRAFWMGETSVTQKLWTAIMGCNPSQFKGDELRPVEMVSWDDCQDFLKRLNALDEVRKTDLVFRLPWKEEWEHACRAGSEGKYCRLADETEITETSLDRVAWFKANSDGTTHPVAQKLSNAWGLYDMHGNVGEWTQTENGVNRTERGGSWLWPAEYCLSSGWGEAAPSRRCYNLGLRLCADFSPLACKERER